LKEKIAFFPTPDSVVHLMTTLSNFTTAKKVLDPCFGTGAFFNHILSLNDSLNTNTNIKKDIIGIEYDELFFNDMINTLKEKNNLNETLIHSDYLLWNPSEKLDLIIGNPPYLSSKKLPPDMKQNVKHLTKNDTNIYYAFVLKSIELLNNNGELVFIVPYDFFFNTYGKYLRQQLIDNGYFDTIIDFGDLKLFKNAAPDTIIFKWIKTKQKNNNKLFIKVFKYDGNNRKTNDVMDNLYQTLFNEKNNKNSSYFERLLIENFKTDSFWSLNNETTKKNTDNLNTVDNKNIKLLKDVAVCGVGIVNGCEEVFKLNNELEKTLLDKEKIFIKQFVKAKNISEKIISSEKYLFIPEKMDEKTLKEFPNIYNYLASKKSLLEQRYLPNKQWYEYSVLRNLKTMEKHLNDFKIVVPHLTRKTEKWFGLTKEPYYIAGDCLYIVGNCEEKTIQIYHYLNSKEFTEWYKKYGAKKGQRTVFTQSILNGLKIISYN